MKKTPALNGVKTLQALLTHICRHPIKFTKDVELRTALKSQAGMASLSRAVELETGESLTTLPMSLNTLKTYANENLSGGFRALNDLRIGALEKLDLVDKREKHTNKRTKSGLNRKVEQLERELEMQRQTNMILMRALSESMHQLTSIGDASDEKLRGKRIQNALQTLRAIVSMARPPFNFIPSTTEPAMLSFEIANIDDYRRK